MTVPDDFRRNSGIPRILKLHYANLPHGDVQIAQGFEFTRPLVTILDLIEDGKVERRFILQALTESIDRGLITRRDTQHLDERTGRKIVEEVLRQAA
jgi:hypothetical protein